MAKTRFDFVMMGVNYALLFIVSCGAVVSAISQTV